MLVKFTSALLGLKDVLAGNSRSTSLSSNPFIVERGWGPGRKGGEVVSWGDIIRRRILGRNEKGNNKD